MTEVIIATHAELAKGYKSALEMFFGTLPFLKVLSAYTQEAPDPQRQIKEWIGNKKLNDQLIILTDLMYGSVNQCFFPYLQQEGVIVITGINFPLVLEITSMIANQQYDLNLKSLIERAKEEIRYVNETEILHEDANGEAELL